MNIFKTGVIKIKIAAILVIMVLYPSVVIGQNPNREKLDAYKIAFFTRRLNLAPLEAEKFWPLYNDYQNRRMLIQNERAYLNRKYNLEVTTMNEKELTEAGDKLIELQVKETELVVTFHKQIKKVLPPEKVIRLYHVENQYRMQLLNQLQERRSQRNDVRPGGNLRP